MISKLLVSICILFAGKSVQAQEQCNPLGIVFGFFNGVQTTEAQARIARLTMEKIYPATTPNGEPITYDLFYNDTEGFSDFVETFDQRLQEQNGLLAERFGLILFFRAQAEAVI